MSKLSAIMAAHARDVTKRTARKNPVKTSQRIALQAQLASTLWATIQTYPDTAAGKEAAIAAAKITHKKIPAQAMRVIRVKRAA